MIRAIVGQAVQAAEQYGGNNEEKKRQAIGLAQKWLDDRGIYLDLHDLMPLFGNLPGMQQLMGFRAMDVRSGTILKHGYIELGERKQASKAFKMDSSK